MTSSRRMCATWIAGCLAVVSIAPSARAAEAPLVVGDGVAMPRQIADRPAAWPTVAREAGVSGLVLLDLTLGESGKPAEIRVLQGRPMLDVAAIEAVKTWRYEPTVVDGVPRSVRLIVAVEFFDREDHAVRAYRDVARARSKGTPARLLAVQKLAVLAASHADAARALRDLSSDRDPAVARQATAALSGVESEGGRPAE